MKYSAVLFSLAISGCTIQQTLQVEIHQSEEPNSLQTHTTVTSNDTKTTPVVKTIKSNPTTTPTTPTTTPTNVCVYEMPVLFNQPQLPDNLKQNAVTTSNELINSMISYIKEMKDTSAKNRKLLADTYAEYLSKCKK